jgi:hypothetical protein
MAKVTYASLKLKANTDIVEIKYNDANITVLQYLPFEDKYSLIMSAVKNALENGIYNPLKLDMFFHLYLVYLYTNISFTDKQREDEAKLYDTLKSTGLMDEVIKAIPESEYTTLYTYLEEVTKYQAKYNRSVVSLVQSLINDLPAQAQAAMDIVNTFDKEKYQNVIDFAKAANGGRAIK